jgi:hypothetical protein
MIISMNGQLFWAFSPNFSCQNHISETEIPIYYRSIGQSPISMHKADVMLQYSDHLSGHSFGLFPPKSTLFPSIKFPDFVL